MSVRSDWLGAVNSISGRGWKFLRVAILNAGDGISSSSLCRVDEIGELGKHVPPIENDLQTDDANDGRQCDGQEVITSYMDMRGVYPLCPRVFAREFQYH